MISQDIFDLARFSLKIPNSIKYIHPLAEQRKLDLAAKRIGKVIKLTIENDSMKKQYNETALRFKENVKKVEKVLEDRTIDNTMSGAKKRLEDFYNYKQNEKSGIISDSLDLEALFNNLATRLAHHKRPAYIPPEGVSLKDVERIIKHLEECEQERKVALHQELNRQLRLLSLDAQHNTRYEKLKKWIEEKEAFLKKKEIIESVSAAQLHLRLLDAYDKEAESTLNGTVSTAKELGAEMIREKYERSAQVQEREKDIDTCFQTLSQLSKDKRPVLEDDLAREIYKEKVRLWASQHGNQWEKVCQWIQESEKYLQTREVVQSIAEANTQLSLLEAFEEEKNNTHQSIVSQLKALGKEILTAYYETKYSKWVYEKPEEITSHENHVDDKWNSMAKQSAEKKKILEDHLARETYKEKVLMANRNHISKHEKLVSWFNEKSKYLQTKEEINSVTEAQTQLTLLQSYEEEKTRTTTANVAPLKKLGNDIKAMKYETAYSSYVFENPAEIDVRATDIDTKWQQLAGLSVEKKRILEADLEREKEKERLRVEFATLANDFIVWTKERSEDAGVFDFGFEIEFVEAYAKTLEFSNQEIETTRASKQKAYQNVWENMQKMNVVANPYTRLTPNDLSNATVSLNNAIEAKKQAYQKELERQRYNDKICKEFANLAEPFIKNLNEAKEKITASQAELEDQLKYVDSKVQSQSTDGAPLRSIKEAQTKIDDAGINNNRHTTLTAQDVEVQWKQYVDFLAKKKKMIETEIEHNKLRGITQEQFKEIDDQFKQYDKDSSNSIDRKELKACLYSLGEEKNNKEVSEILQKYGDGKAIKYDGFKEFMIDTLGVSDTKDDIINAFYIINKQKFDTKTIRPYMEQVMEDHDTKYVEGTAPKLEDGYDYRAWSEDVFSR